MVEPCDMTQKAEASQTYDCTHVLQACYGGDVGVGNEVIPTYTGRLRSQDRRSSDHRLLLLAQLACCS